jgi:hypothetical protein
MYNEDTGTYWHNGAISGYTNYSFFNPKGGYAAVVLVNQTSPVVSFADLAAQHVRQRLSSNTRLTVLPFVMQQGPCARGARPPCQGLSGEPAISLAAVTVPASSGFWSVIRTLLAYWMIMLAAGVFVFCCVLGLQGLAAQLLPRRLFLHLSSFLQLGFWPGLHRTGSWACSSS